METNSSRGSWATEGGRELGWEVGRGAAGSGRLLSPGLDKPIWHSRPLKSPTTAPKARLPSPAGPYQVLLCLIWTRANIAEDGLQGVKFCSSWTKSLGELCFCPLTWQWTPGTAPLAVAEPRFHLGCARYYTCHPGSTGRVWVCRSVCIGCYSRAWVNSILNNIKLTWNNSFLAVFMGSG